MQLYGLNWPYSDPVDVEIDCIKNNGRWYEHGRWWGEGLQHHYQALESLLWPWKKWDPWSELILGHLLTNRLVVMVGPANATKTHTVASYMLTRYIVYPERNCNLVSSTDSRSLELRVWGEIKKLWNEARQRYPATPGRLVESRQMLVTDVEGDKATDYRNGIVGVPTMVGNTYQGLGKFVGIKAGSVFLAADEASFMGTAFFDAISNMSKNAGFCAAVMGNPKDRTDCLGKLAEPEDGWESYAPTGKTMVWKTRFRGGICIQLDGRDSPNNVAGSDNAWPFPHLINREDIARDVAYYGEDSIQVSMMDFGVFPKDAQARRVITRSMCERHRAQEEPVWSHEELTHVFCLDAAYGAVGGDRCVGIELVFGKCSDGVKRLAFAGPPMIIPVKADRVDDDGKPVLPEDQIAKWVQDYCENPQRDDPIPLAHVGFDSTGRGSLVAAFARLWGSDFHAVEFGGQATERPVSLKIRTPCRDYYSSFVTELWFNTVTLIVSDQLRGLPTSVMEEGCMRAWNMIREKRIELEPKVGTPERPGCKMRMGRSPDLYDAFVVGVEVAQRLGFSIGQAPALNPGHTPRWMEEVLDSQRRLRENSRLVYR